MAFPGITSLTQANFTREVLESYAPVLVYFWAEWCGSCKAIAPVLDEMAAQYKNRVKIGKVNIEEQPALAAEYGIRAVPTLLLIREGQVADRLVGPHSKYKIEQVFDLVAA